MIFIDSEYFFFLSFYFDFGRQGRDATPYLERNRVGRDAIDSAAALTDMGKYLFRERRLPVYDIAVAITKYVNLLHFLLNFLIHRIPRRNYIKLYSFFYDYENLVKVKKSVIFYDDTVHLSREIGLELFVTKIFLFPL